MRSLVIFWVKVICLASVLYLTAGKFVDVPREVDNVLRDLNPSLSSKTPSPLMRYCQCVKYECGCCVTINWEKVKIVNATGCVNISYLPDQIGFSVLLTLNGLVLYNKTVSARNPPPICIDVPYLKKELSLCLDLYNLDYTKQYISGCAKLEAHIAFVVVESIDLGCFRFQLHGAVAQRNAEATVKSIQAARMKMEPYKHFS